MLYKISYMLYTISNIINKTSDMLYKISYLYKTATGFILQHRFFANFTCLSSLLRYFKPLKNINIGRRH